MLLSLFFLAFSTGRRRGSYGREKGKKFRPRKGPPIKTKPRYLGGPSLDSDLVVLPSSSHHIYFLTRQKSIILSKEVYALFRNGSEDHF